MDENAGVLQDKELDLEEGEVLTDEEEEPPAVPGDQVEDLEAEAGDGVKTDFTLLRFKGTQLSKEELVQANVTEVGSFDLKLKKHFSIICT